MAPKTLAARGVIQAAATAGDALTDARAAFAVVGGLAVAARAEPRFTRDVDLAVRVADDAEAERLVHRLSRSGYGVETLIEQRATGRLATARLRHESSHEIFIDLLFASSGIEPELVAAAQPLAYASRRVLPVARTGHLIALKVLSEGDERLQDRLDLRALARVAVEEDWTLALESVRLIQARGFHRGRALARRVRALRNRSV